MPLLAIVRQRGTALTARAEQTSALAEMGESSSTSVELDLIVSEMQWLRVLAGEIAAQRETDLKRLLEARRPRWRLFPSRWRRRSA
jgi:hypothetical protein